MLLLENRLAGITKSDLRPNELRHVETNADEYCRFLTVLRDGFISTLAYKKFTYGRGKKKREVTIVKEVHRWLPRSDEHFFCDYLSQPYMYADWSVIFWEQDFKKRFWHYSAKSPRHGLKFNEFPSDRNRNLPIGKELYGYEEFMKFMKENVHKYFYMQREAYNDFDERHFVWRFAWYYRNNLPVSEIFCKIGYPCFMVSKAACSFDKKTMKRFGKWLQENGESVTIGHGMAVTYPFRDIMYCFRHNITKEQNEKRIIKNYIMRSLSKNKEEAKELYSYLKKQHYCRYYREVPTSAVDHYRDYINKCSDNGLDVSERGVQFPRDFDERLRQMALEERRKADRKKNREFNAKLRKVPQSLGLEEVFVSANGLRFIIPTKVSQFKQLGDRLHMCVGTCGYKEKMVNGRCLIIGVWKGNKPVNCIELEQPTKETPRYRTLQNRGDHNNDSECQEDVTKALATYIAMANEQWRTTHGIA